MPPEKIQKLKEAIKSGKVTDKITLQVFMLVEDLKAELERTVKQVKDSEVSLNKISELMRGRDGAPGQKGERGFDGQNGKDGLPGRDGQNGKDGLPGRDGAAGLPGENGNIKDLSPEEIRDSLELLQGENRLDESAIKGLREKFDIIEKKVASSGGKTFMGGTVSRFDIYDLSSQTNSVLKTFSVPGMAKPYYVMGSDFPTILFLNNGFTYSAANNTITLTTDNAPSTGSQLGIMYSF